METKFLVLLVGLSTSFFDLSTLNEIVVSDAEV